MFVNRRSTSRGPKYSQIYVPHDQRALAPPPRIIQTEKEAQNYYNQLLKMGYIYDGLKFQYSYYFNNTPSNAKLDLRLIDVNGSTFVRLYRVTNESGVILEDYSNVNFIITNWSEKLYLDTTTGVITFYTNFPGNSTQVHQADVDITLTSDPSPYKSTISLYGTNILIGNTDSLYILPVSGSKLWVYPNSAVQGFIVE